MFIEDNTIYSYGKHYALASRLDAPIWRKRHNFLGHTGDRSCLINTKNYSPSTWRQLSYVHRALHQAGWNLYHVKDCNVYRIGEDVREAIAPILRKVGPARSCLDEYVSDILGELRRVPELMDRVATGWEVKRDCLADALFYLISERTHHPAHRQGALRIKALAQTGHEDAKHIIYLIAKVRMQGWTKGMASQVDL
jgi:hypothetical protein